MIRFKEFLNYYIGCNLFRKDGDLINSKISLRFREFIQMRIELKNC